MGGSSIRPPEVVRRELVENWLAGADEDLAAATALQGQEGRFASQIAFLAQQAAEKYLKALITHHGTEFPKTHDLEALLKVAESVASGLSDPLRDSIVLTRYAVETRYPGGVEPLTRNQAERAVQLASQVGRAVRERLA